jgi:hypothetical protein
LDVLSQIFVCAQPNIWMCLAKYLDVLSQIFVCAQPNICMCSAKAKYLDVLSQISVKAYKCDIYNAAVDNE